MLAVEVRGNLDTYFNGHLIYVLLDHFFLLISCGVNHSEVQNDFKKARRVLLRAILLFTGPPSHTHPVLRRRYYQNSETTVAVRED